MSSLSQESKRPLNKTFLRQETLPNVCPLPTVRSYLTVGTQRREDFYRPDGSGSIHWEYQRSSRRSVCRLGNPFTLFGPSIGIGWGMRDQSLFSNGQTFVWRVSRWSFGLWTSLTLNILSRGECTFVEIILRNPLKATVVNMIYWDDKCDSRCIPWSFGLPSPLHTGLR